MYRWMKLYKVFLKSEIGVMIFFFSFEYSSTSIDHEFK